MTDFDDEAAVLVQVADELVTQQRTAGNLTIELPPIAGLQLATLLQQLLRSRLTPASRTLAGALLVLVQEYFADCPAVLAVLAAGAAPDPAAWPADQSNARH